MNTTYFLIGGLFLITALAVLLFAWRSKVEVEKRKNDPDAPKSTLAADAPSSR